MVTNELVAGRELDALVADNVMGRTVTDHYGDGSSLWIGWGDKEEQPLPAYSTDIAAAWLVIEKMIARGWSFTFEQDREHATAIFDRPREMPEYGGTLEGNVSAPLAICRAALAAVDHHQFGAVGPRSTSSTSMSTSPS